VCAHRISFSLSKLSIKYKENSCVVCVCLQCFTVQTLPAI
jgi:hypothetical protein